MCIAYLNAAQFAGLIIDSATGKGLDAELSINGQKVSIDDRGRYQAEVPEQKQNEYLLNITNGGYYLFVTRRNHLNLQMSVDKEIIAERQDSKFMHIDITLQDNGIIVPKADVFIYAVREKPNRAYIAAENKLRDYNHGQVKFNYLQYADNIYILVSRNSELYIQKLENIVPEKIHGLSIDLVKFKKLDNNFAGVAYQTKDKAIQIAGIPTANNYYVSQNVLPVFKKNFNEYTMLYLGNEPKFPEDLNYYNVRELIYAGDNGLLTVYTDIKTESIDVSRYGKYELIAVRGYQQKRFNFRNFSPAKLKDFTEAFVLERPRENGE